MHTLPHAICDRKTYSCHGPTVNRQIEQGLTSHQTHSIGHIGDGFYGSNDLTNSVKAPKEDRS